MKGALRVVLTPQDARVPRAGGRPRRRSARKGGDGGAPTHHGERSASVGAGVGVGTESESLGDAWAEVTCAPGSGVEVQPLGLSKQLKDRGRGDAWGLKAAGEGIPVARKMKSMLPSGSGPGIAPELRGASESALGVGSQQPPAQGHKEAINQLNSQGAQPKVKASVGDS